MFFFKEENWPGIKKYLEILRNPTVDVVCDERDLDLSEDTVPQMTVVNCLKRIDINPITYEISFPLRNCTFLLEIQLKYVQDVIVTRDT